MSFASIPADMMKSFEEGLCEHEKFAHIEYGLGSAVRFEVSVDIKETSRAAKAIRQLGLRELQAVNRRRDTHFTERAFYDVLAQAILLRGTDERNSRMSITYISDNIEGKAELLVRNKVKFEMYTQDNTLFDKEFTNIAMEKIEKEIKKYDDELLKKKEEKLKSQQSQKQGKKNDNKESNNNSNNKEETPREENITVENDFVNIKKGTDTIYTTNSSTFPQKKGSSFTYDLSRRVKYQLGHLQYIRFQDPCGLHIMIERSYDEYDSDDEHINDTNNSSDDDENSSSINKETVQEKEKEYIEPLDDDENDTTNNNSNSTDSNSKKKQSSSLNRKYTANTFMSPLPHFNMMSHVKDVDENGDDEEEIGRDGVMCRRKKNSDKPSDDTVTRTKKKKDDDKDKKKKDNNNNDDDDVNNMTAASSKRKDLISRLKNSENVPLAEATTWCGIIVPIWDSNISIIQVLRFYRALGFNFVSSIGNGPQDYVSCSDGKVIIAFIEHPGRRLALLQKPSLFVTGFDEDIVHSSLNKKGLYNKPYLSYCDSGSGALMLCDLLPETRDMSVQDAENDLYVLPFVISVPHYSKWPIRIGIGVLTTLVMVLLYFMMSYLADRKNSLHIINNVRSLLGIDRFKDVNVDDLRKHYENEM